MFTRYFIIIALCLFVIIGCGRFDNEYTSVTSSDEVNTVRVSCVNFLGVPTMCAVINETTRTIRIESLVTEIVNRIVKKEVVTEVPVEKIVTRVETRYILTGKEVDIEEIVKYIIARIKEYVEPTDIVDVPIEVIVDETTESITNAPPPDNVTTLWVISATKSRHHRRTKMTGRTAAQIIVAPKVGFHPKISLGPTIPAVQQKVVP